MDDDEVTPVFGPSRHWAPYENATQREPVVIMKDKQEPTVLLSALEYRRPKRRSR